MIYSRKKTHEKSRKPTIVPEQCQSKIPRNESLNTQGTLNPNLPVVIATISNYTVSRSQFPIDLNILTANEKGTQTCT